jgi:hypothetical protein
MNRLMYATARRCVLVRSTSSSGGSSSTARCWTPLTTTFASSTTTTRAAARPLSTDAAALSTQEPAYESMTFEPTAPALQQDQWPTYIREDVPPMRPAMGTPPPLSSDALPTPELMKIVLVLQARVRAADVPLAPLRDQLRCTPNSNKITRRRLRDEIRPLKAAREAQRCMLERAQSLLLWRSDK